MALPAAAALSMRLVAASATSAFGPAARGALLQARHASSWAASSSNSSSSGTDAGASAKTKGAAVALSVAAAAALAGATQQRQWRAEADASATPSSAAASRDAPPADPYARPSPAGALPRDIVLYQYEVCPFCCKVKALLDYYDLPYETVEVNPLTKAELKWSTYRKVPVARMDGGARVAVDSSAIMSELAAELEAAGRAPAPAPAAAAGGGGKRGLFGRGGSGGSSNAPASLEEEARWRRWVDERLVRVLTANIYRSWDETWRTFSYIAAQSHWGWASQQAVRLGGSLIMWRVGKGMPAKYGIDGDLRAALYREVDALVDALAGRDFLGGAAPNLADLSAFGVLRAVQGTPTYNDVVLHTRVGPWLARMSAAVGESAEVKRGGGGGGGAPAAAPAAAA